MTKKIILIALIPALFIYLTGCFSMYDISQEDLKPSSNSKLWVMTGKGDSYLFQENSYKIRKDSLFGISSGDNQPLMKKTIPLNDVYALQIEKLNGINSALTVLGAGIGLFCLAILVLLNGINSTK